jgi:adenylate cyclase
MPQPKVKPLADVSYMLRQDLRQTHVRRTRVMVIATSAVVILISAYWAVYFAMRAQWILLPLPVGTIAMSAIAWFLSWRKRQEVAAILMIISLLFIIIGMALLQDIPSAEVPRSVHHFLIVIAVGAYLMLKEEHDFLAHGIPVVCMLAFIALGSSSFGVVSPFALPDEVRRSGTWVNNTFSMAGLYLLLHVFSGDINRMERYLHAANNRFISLVGGMFPRAIAERLLSKGETFAERHVDCSILFADIVGFTRIADQMKPEALVGMLAEIFARFDACVEARGLTKIKTIGDAYMVAGGVPEPIAGHASLMVELAKDMLEAVHGYPGIDLRIGIASGELVAGVIGQSRQVFDVWGDVVNVASRMESQGLPGRIQVSRSCYDLTCDRYAYDLRSGLSIKGKDGLHDVFLLRPR